MKGYLWLSPVFALLCACLPLLANAADQELQTTVVNFQPVKDVRWFDGVVEAVNSSTVSAQTSGRIVSLDFDVDDYVQAGEVIVRFSDAENKARLSQSLASLDAASATRQGAEDEFKRMKKLIATGVVSKARYDSAKATFDAALAHENTAAAAVDQAREQLAYTVVRAPYSGLVKARHVEIGEVASQGQPLMTGFSLEKLRVTVSVPQQFAQIIRSSNTAQIVDDEGITTQSKSLTVFPFADEKSNTVTVRVALPADVKDIFPGMLLKTGFVVGTINTLTIPKNAVARRGEVTGVYLTDSTGRLQFQQIRVGRIVSEFVEVLSGLLDGDQIVVDAMKATLLRYSRSSPSDE